MSNLADVVSKAAPLLGEVLGGPVGGVAASIIANVFGATTNDQDDLLKKISTDPDAIIKLKKIESDHEVSLLQIKAKMYSDDIADRENARNFNLNLNGSSKAPIMLWFLVIMIFGVGFGCLYGMTTHQDIKSELAMVLTACIYEFKNVYRLFTGDVRDDDTTKGEKR